MEAIIVFALLVLSIAGLIVLFYIRSKVRTEFEEFVLMTEGLSRQIITDEEQPYLYWQSNEHRASLLGPVRYIGYFKLADLSVSMLPTRMNAGESAMLLLIPKLEIWADNESLLIMKTEALLDPEKFGRLRNVRTQFKSFILSELTKEVIPWTGSKNNMKYFAVELLAPTFTISGNSKQRQRLGTPGMNYAWSISSNKTGRHQVILKLSLENESGGNSVPIAIISRKIEVAAHGLFTRRQIETSLRILEIAAALLGIILALKTLGVLP